MFLSFDNSSLHSPYSISFFLSLLIFRPPFFIYLFIYFFFTSPVFRFIFHDSDGILLILPSYFEILSSINTKTSESYEISYPEQRNTCISIIYNFCKYCYSTYKVNKTNKINGLIYDYFSISTLFIF